MSREAGCRERPRFDALAWSEREQRSVATLARTGEAQGCAEYKFVGNKFGQRTKCAGPEGARRRVSRKQAKVRWTFAPANERGRSRALAFERSRIA
ncbi:MAG: hypothetical protein A3E57_04145 [Candidatus Muproteobacteria bacterium RIFCSPHIGHO2_12_FULL_60_33]|nr:MAG: hypothetical protein A2W42_01135 [Candidatus Muproteobacteria bacterium RIFCSPHIGHO2_01_60_12]OGI54106.1 MAG: hypothetical protein A3E57_04145 [Candidatus Muproteobacteria bacterium RIFCSPHIGHO2_12_FULL_60_33]OGI58072.1 MAG: hypothetical protein A2809_04195 [Candidatus Muproteobacteria bacterium RIFCSPHIGHO2_01_FULL_61_200]